MLKEMKREERKINPHPWVVVKRKSIDTKVKSYEI